MSTDDSFRAIVGQLRSWGFRVVDWDGCYGWSNGSDWSAGRPVGHGNHHYVCSMNPDQSYIDALVANLANGKVVNWFADVHGVAYLIGTGPMNHFGTGNQSVLDRTRADQPPVSNPANGPGSISGNPHYSGTECQHPGDSTPWPSPMLDVMVAINAAEFIVFGYTAARAINHSEFTDRKIDMSAGGGINSGGWAGDELRRRVAARMTGGTIPPMEGVPMPLVVKRENGSVDWAWSTDLSVMIRIPTENFYKNLQFAGVIETDHGAAEPCDSEFVSWFRGQVLGAGGTVYEPAQ